MVWLRRVLLGFTALLLAGAGAGAAWLALTREPGQGLLAAAVSQIASSSDTKVRIMELDGLFWGPVTLRGLTLSDRTGPWLEADLAEIDFSRLGALSGAVSVTRFAAGTVDILRAPKGDAPSPDDPLLPELPVSLDLGGVSIDTLRLGTDLGVPAMQLRVSEADLRYGTGRGPVSLRIDAERRDAPGRYMAALAFDRQTHTLTLAAQVDEPPGGLIGTLAELPTGTPVKIAANGEGPLETWTASVTAEAGPGLSLSGTAAITREGEAFRVAANATGTLDALLPPPLQQAAGGLASLDVTAIAKPDRAFTIDRIALTAGRLAVEGKGTRAADGAITASLGTRDFAAFAALAGVAVRGGASLDLSSPGFAPGEPLAVAAELRLDGFGMDGPGSALLGPSPVVKMLAKLGAGGVTFDTLSVEGEGVSLAASGTLGPEAADLALTGTLKRLGAVDRRLGGTAELKARLTRAGTWSLDATAVTSGLVLDGLEAGRVELGIRAADLAGPLAADVTAKGTLTGLPLNAAASLSAGAGGLSAEALDVTLGSSRLTGAVRAEDGLLSGDGLRVSAPRLAELSRLAGTALAGAVTGALSLGAVDGRQTASVSVTGDTLSIGGTDLSGLDVQGTLAGGDAALTAVARVADLDLVFAATGPFDGGVLSLETVSVSRGGETLLALEGPARLQRDGAGYRLARTAFAVGGGSVMLSGLIGPALDLAATLEAVPLDLARGFGVADMPTGIVSGPVTVSGSAADPAASFDLTVSRLMPPAFGGARLPPVSAALAGRYEDGALSVQVTAEAGTALALNASGTLSRAGRLEARAEGKADAALANAFLGGGSSRAGGTLTFDLRAGGTLAAPSLGGTASLSNGSFADEALGVRLSKIEAALEGDAGQLGITRLSARAPNGGTLEGSGTLRLGAGDGPELDVSLTSRRALLVSTSMVSLVADTNLTLRGPLAGQAVLAGTVRAISLEVSLDDLPPDGARPLEGMRHVDPPPQVALRLARDEAAGAAGGTGFDPLLDITVSAPRRIVVRGRGLDAELGGELKLSGPLSAPETQGGFRLRRGELSLLTQKLSIARGRIGFDGSLVPSLEFLATTRAGGIDASIAVTGTADRPAFEISSTPDLPQDEVLSYILFQKASGDLTALQALDLARAVDQLSGGDGAGGALEGMRRSLGLDALSVDAGSEGLTLGAAKALTDSVRVGVKTGATPETSSVTLDIAITDSINAQAEASGDGSAAAGAGFEIEY